MYNRTIIWIYKSRFQKECKITYVIKRGTMQPILDKRNKAQS